MQFTLRADLFDEILLVVEYEEQVFDAFSIRLVIGDYPGMVMARMGSNMPQWKSIHHLPIDLQQIARAIEDNPYFYQPPLSVAVAVIDFIQWLGLEPTLQNFLFFLSVPQWVSKDYPKAYLLLGWGERKWVKAGESLSPALLMKWMDRPISKSQLKNLRKLVDDGSAVEDFYEAALAIVTHFEILQPLIKHQKTLTPTLVNRYMRYYFDCQYFRYMDWLMPLVKAQGFELIDFEIVPLLEELSFLSGVLGKEVNFTELLSERVRSVKKLNALYAQWQNEYQCLKMQEELNKWPDDYQFPENRLLETAYFTKVQTAGRLRQIAAQFNNCAANYVEDTVSGDSYFFHYHDVESEETALMKVDPLDDERPIKEFFVRQYLGANNQSVSSAAETHLQQWIDIQSGMIRISSGVWSDEKALCDHGLFESGYFRKVKTVGRLREIVNELNIPYDVGVDVEAGVSGHSYFFYYQNAQSEETALLLVVPVNNQGVENFMVSEYVRFGGQHVSTAALVHLQEWINIQPCVVGVNPQIGFDLRFLEKTTCDKPRSCNQLLWQTINFLLMERPCKKNA